MRCRHYNMEIDQIYETCTTHFVNNGKVVGHTSDPEGDYTGMVEVRCFDCGMRKRFRAGRRSPKWLRKYLARARYEKRVLAGKEKDDGNKRDSD